MAQTIGEALRGATFHTDGVDYLLAGLPPASIGVAAVTVAAIGSPFCVMIADKDEVSLLVPAVAMERFGGRLGEPLSTDGPFRLITVDVPLDPALVGFMAHLSAALAATGTPIFPYASHSRDHIIVPAARLDDALRVLERLKAEAMAGS